MHRDASHPHRRDCLALGAAAVAGLVVPGPGRARPDEKPKRVKPRPVAAVLTVYRHNSHADVLIGKILEGWKQDGGAGPALKLVSMYVDQFPADDLARKLSRKYGVPIFDSIEKAVTVGGKTVEVCCDECAQKLKEAHASASAQR